MNEGSKSIMNPVTVSYHSIQYTLCSFALSKDMQVKIEILCTCSYSCMMACWRPNLKGETSRQILYDYKAKCYVCLWIFMYICNWYENWNISHKCDIEIYKKLYFFWWFFILSHSRGMTTRVGEERGCKGSWWGNQREWHHWGDLGLDGWIILGWISRRWDVGIWTGLGWPRIETGGGRLWVQ